MPFSQSRSRSTAIEPSPGDRAIARIYTDGACSGNPGPGGWGVAVYFADGTVGELGGAAPETTNNRMEMQAAIEALKVWRALGETRSVTLYTDSEYVKKGATQWLAGWKRKGWKTASGKPVLNRDLWETLDRLNAPAVEWRYVRGHAGDPGNERCDAIARGFSLGRPPTLQPLVLDAPPDERADRSAAGPPPGGDRSVGPSLVTYPSEPNSHTATMTESLAAPNYESTDGLVREVRVNELRNLIETLHVADEVAKQGYLITSSELADLMDVNASAVTSRGDNWVWRNWIVTRVRREGNQILWQLERVEM